MAAIFVNGSKKKEKKKKSDLYRGPSIDASYQVSYHLAKRFQRKSCFKNRPIRNKNCLWRPCLLMDRDKMSNLYRGPSIDVSYQVSVHLAKRFQRTRFLEIYQSETKLSVAAISHSEGLSDSGKSQTKIVLDQ